MENDSLAKKNTRNQKKWLLLTLFPGFYKLLCLLLWFSQNARKQNCFYWWYQSELGRLRCKKKQPPNLRSCAAQSSMYHTLLISKIILLGSLLILVTLKLRLHFKICIHDSCGRGKGRDKSCTNSLFPHITSPKISMTTASYGFPSSHVQMWELDHKEGWVVNNWCFWIVLEKTLESPLDCKEIKAVNPKGNQPWIFIGRTDAEAPVLWPPDAKSQLIGKDPDAGKDWQQKEKGAAEDEMVR